MQLQLYLEGQSDSVLAEKIIQRVAPDVQVKSHVYRNRAKLLERLPNIVRGLTKDPGFRKVATDPAARAMIALFDADRDDCALLKAQVLRSFKVEMTRNMRVRIAVEESEAWLLSDWSAIQAAYPDRRLKRPTNYSADKPACGTWELLADAVGRSDLRAPDVSFALVGQWKSEVACEVAPHLDLDDPKSPSLKAFIEAVHAVTGR